MTDFDSDHPTPLQQFGRKAKLVAESIRSRGRNLIYVPQRYGSDPEYRERMQQLEPIRYSSQGNQMVAWMPPLTNKPKRVWLFFSGNASLALNWMPVLSLVESTDAAFVMMEYPGYGECEGKPSSDAIINSVDQLIESVCQRFEIDLSQISDTFRVMGSSLGAAIALQTAAQYQLHKGVIIAPFTSIRDVGVSMSFPKLLLSFSADPYDNLARLSEIYQNRNPQTRFHIIHGEEDQLLPLSMGENLHESFPEITNLWPIPSADHYNVKLKQTANLARAIDNDGDFYL